MMRLSYVLIVAFLLASSLAAHAQNVAAPAAPTAAPAAATPAIDPKAQALALEIVKLVNARAAFQSVFQALSKNMMTLVQRDNPTKSQEESQKIVGDAFQQAMAAHYDEIDANSANLYAQNYSVDELQKIADFYKSPVGQKMLTSMPEMMQKSMAVNMPILKTVVKEAMASVAASLKKSGMNVPKEVGS